MRRMMRRRSVSILVSPPPKRAPTPPRCWDSFASRATAQTWEPVAQQREFDLCLALQGVRVLAEDVEDHRGAVERRASEQLLQVELLARLQLVVEHHGVGVDGEAELMQLLGLALADVPGVVGRIAPLHHAADLVGAGGVDQQRELVEAGLDGLLVVLRSGHGDQHDAFTDRAVDERRRERLVVRRGHDGSAPSSMLDRADVGRGPVSET